MNLDAINLNQIRVFECVYRTKSMTEAARELHLTQSGVSQHMRQFEDSLDLKLFDRLKQRLVPTPEAHLLYKRSVLGLNHIEDALVEIKGGHTRLRGRVSLGMPIEFGNNLILPLLHNFSLEYPEVTFDLRYGFATEMNQRLLDGELDFAFVDAFTLDRKLFTEKVYDETLVLAAHPDLVKTKGSVKNERRYFEALPYAAYQEGEPMLRHWFKTNLGTAGIKLDVKMRVMDVQAISRAILMGLAVGVLPSYLVSSLEKQGHRFHKFKGKGKVVQNPISVAYFKEKTRSQAADQALQFLLNALKKKA